MHLECERSRAILSVGQGGLSDEQCQIAVPWQYDMMKWLEGFVRVRGEKESLYLKVTSD